MNRCCRDIEAMAAANYRDVASLRFLHPVSNRDRNVRKHALDAIIQTVETWMTGNCTPFNSLEQIHGGGLNGNLAIAKLQERIPDLLRLLCSCPFKDVRDKTKALLEDLKVLFFFILKSFYVYLGFFT